MKYALDLEDCKIINYNKIKEISYEVCIGLRRL